MSGNSGLAADPFSVTAPHDNMAEMSVLGGMILSDTVIADVSDQITAADFYKPAHQTIYQALIDQMMSSEPVDEVTVSSRLRNEGSLVQIGGADYLGKLIDTVPEANNAPFYARIVAERALARRLMEATTRGQQLALGPGNAADNYARVLSEIEAVSQVRVGTGYVQLTDGLTEALERIEDLSKIVGQTTGVPTGFTELDTLTAGLHGGQLIVVAARPGVGKALALDTPLPTPTGWTTMGQVQAGDLLLDASGHPTRVLAVTGVLTDRPCYEVTFSDGTVIVADEQHQWLTVRVPGTDPQDFRVVPVNPTVQTTREIAESLHPGAISGVSPRVRHGVTVTAPLVLPAADLPVDPYLLGVLLAALGGTQFGRLDPEITPTAAGRPGHASITKRSDTTSSHLVHPDTAASNLLNGSVSIPQVYLRGSDQQRRDLLAGLLDPSGNINAFGTVTLDLFNAQLATDTHELALSLGYRAMLTSRPFKQPTEASGTAGTENAPSTRWRVRFTPHDKVFGIARKNVLINTGSSQDTRYITKVRPVASVPVRCVEVDNPAHLYLASRAMIPTHNSTLGMDFIRACSIKHGLPSVLFSLEMSYFEITMRMLSAEARIPLQNIRTGKMKDDDWDRLGQRLGALHDAPIFIDDNPSINMLEIRAKARQIKQRNGLSLIVVDYLQLMKSPGKTENRQQEVADISRSLKLLAKELDCPVVAMSQLNRGSENRADKTPQLADLRESGAIEQDADMVVLLYREDAFDKESTRAGEADLIVAKHRNGPTRTITVASQLHYSRFYDMAPSE